MKKQFFILLFLAFAAYGQQERVAIINTMDDYDSISVSALTYLTDRLREAAVNILPAERFGVMTTESIVAFLGSQENAVKVCKESSCLADLGRQVSADYVAQGRIGRFNEDLTIKVELYSVKSGNLMGSFTGSSKDISELLALIDEKATDLFKKMIVEAKPIVVEKPEVAKMEIVKLEPKLEPDKPKVEKPFPRTGFWVAVGLDVLGAGMFVAGYLKNEKMNEAYERYSEKGQPPEFYKAAKEDVESERSSRNLFYVVGSLFLVSGIGVHIWF